MQVVGLLTTMLGSPTIKPVPEDTHESENPVFVSIEKRLALIERLSQEAFGTGLDDIPIDAETASLITGLAVRTIINRGAEQRIDTIKIGKKLQFSLRGCIELVNESKRKAIKSEADIAAYNHSKEVLKRVKKQVV